MLRDSGIRPLIEINPDAEERDDCVRRRDLSQHGPAHDSCGGTPWSPTACRELQDVQDRAAPGPARVAPRHVWSMRRT
jgi:hypothetical protein